jgi:hypothetical protein
MRALRSCSIGFEPRMPLCLDKSDGATGVIQRIQKSTGGVNRKRHNRSLPDQPRLRIHRTVGNARSTIGDMVKSEGEELIWAVLLMECVMSGIPGLSRPSLLRRFAEPSLRCVRLAHCFELGLAEAPSARLPASPRKQRAFKKRARERRSSTPPRSRHQRKAGPGRVGTAVRRNDGAHDAEISVRPLATRNGASPH